MTKGTTTSPATATEPTTTITTFRTTTTTNYGEPAKTRMMAAIAVVPDGNDRSEHSHRTDTVASACGPFSAHALLSVSGL